LWCTVVVCMLGAFKCMYEAAEAWQERVHSDLYTIAAAHDLFLASWVGFGV
jgi:hypothetical protein